MTEQSAPKDRRVLIGVAIVAAVSLAGMVACTASLYGGSDSSPASECRSLASDTHGSGHAQFTEVTFVRDTFVKGTIGAYVNGDERTVGHWECSTETGEPVITFYSPAA